MTVTAAFIVKDPPLDRLRALIEYFRPVVQQVVIVVDDRTRPDWHEAMCQWGAVMDDPAVIVIPFHWIDDFAAARNAALTWATGDWVLALDPDELPSVAMIDFIRLVDAAPRQEDEHWQGAMYPAPRGYLFFTRNFFDGRQGAEWEEHWHCRLFRRTAGIWYKPVHEQVMLEGLPESRTRGTPYLPKAPKSAYIIHSRMEDDTRDVQYSAIAAQMVDVPA